MLNCWWRCDTDDNDARDMVTTAHNCCKQALLAADTTTINVGRRQYTTWPLTVVQTFLTVSHKKRLRLAFEYSLECCF